MSRAIPIIRLRGTLLVPVQVALSDQVILALKDDIAREIQAYDAHGLVLEVSGVDIVDSFIAAAIQSIASMAKLMGVRTVVAGLSAGMAITLVEMGMNLDGVETALDLEAALDRLARRAQPARATLDAQRAADEALLLDAASGWGGGPGAGGRSQP